jgi:hypothetical protein
MSRLRVVIEVAGLAIGVLLAVLLRMVEETWAKIREKAGGFSKKSMIR